MINAWVSMREATQSNSCHPVPLLLFTHDQPVYLCIVVLPDAASNLVPTQVKRLHEERGSEALGRTMRHARLEVDSCELELFAGWVLSGRVLNDSIVAQHMHQGRFPSIVEAEEEDLGTLSTGW